MTTKSAAVSLALAGAVSAALATLPASAQELTKEKCFGVSLRA